MFEICTLRAKLDLSILVGEPVEHPPGTLSLFNKTFTAILISGPIKKHQTETPHCEGATLNERTYDYVSDVDPGPPVPVSLIDGVGSLHTAQAGS